MTTDNKLGVSPAAAHLLFEGISNELAEVSEHLQRAQAAWQRNGWRLLPAPTATINGGELPARASIASTLLAATVTHFNELEKSLLAMRATIPPITEDPQTPPGLQ